MPTLRSRSSRTNNARALSPSPDTTSTSASTSVPSTSPSSRASSLTPSSHGPSPELLFKPFRKRNRISSPRKPYPPKPDEMFSSRKYSPLPSSNDPRRKRAGGGMPMWKRLALIGGVTIFVVLLGYTKMPGKKDSGSEAWDAENTYTPDLADDWENPIDEVDYTTPPFRPLDSDIGRPDDEESDMVHILPIDEGRPSTPSNDAIDDDYPLGASPHNPTSDEAKGAAEADDDFTEISDGSTDSAASASFETDPDPASTTHCDEAHDTKRPLVQYALTIDAGSTGSRIHVYKFHNCGPSPQLEYETFMSINPGLSAYARDPTAAAASLDPLLTEAKRVVPEELWKCTPVEVKATAGLRLLGVEESAAILDEVRNRLESNWDFVVPGEKAVEIMDGKDEGVYAWITANYLLNKIGEGATSTDTLAVMDLGGASTQIVFEPIFAADSDQTLVEGEHKYALNFGGKKFTLYQHSYLGYGLMRARRSVHNLVAFTWSFGRGDLEWDRLSETTQISNPCLSAGTTRRVELDPPGRQAVNVTMHGASGGFEACNRIVELVMAKDAVCEVKPCSFNGVYQPSLLDTFPRGQLLALSYFTDRIQPLLSRRSSPTLTIADLAQLAKDVCAGPSVWHDRWAGNEAALAELEERPEYCLDLTFMNALLGLGYELTPQRELMVEKKLNGVELGWALGAGLALVQNAQLTCTA